MKFFPFFLFLSFVPCAFTQTVVPLTDNMDIPSNSNIRIQSGRYAFTDAAKDGVIRIVNKENITIDGDSVKVTGTGIDDTPASTTLHSGCYPNPFSSGVTIWFDLPARDLVRLSVFGLSGRCLALLIDEEMPAGLHETDFSSGEMAPGIYFYRLQTRNKVVTGKLVKGDQ